VTHHSARRRTIVLPVRKTVRIIRLAASVSSRRGLLISPGRRLPEYGRRRLRAEGGRH
jgi:hypothetical protein